MLSLVLFAFLVAAADAFSFDPVDAYDSPVNTISVPGTEYLGRGMADYLWHVGTPGTQHNRERDSDYFYTTNSYIPNLPQLSGFTGTSGNYRAFQVFEEQLVAIGEPKKGLWRIQENGFVRYYRKPWFHGLLRGKDPNNEASLTPRDKYAILTEYGHTRYFHPEMLYYKYEYKDHLNYIDLNIYHEIFHGKYDNHTAIDLPIFYTLISQARYPYVRNLWNFVKTQRLNRKNLIGPLGKRAGLDITENYRKVVRVWTMPDASIWVNTKDNVTGLNPNENGTTTNYQRLDLSTYDYEIYLFERRQYAKKRLYVGLVLNDGTFYGTLGNFSYLRPDPSSSYYNNFVARNSPIDVFNDVPDFYPSVHVLNASDPQHSVGLPVYGHNQPDRPQFGQSGGACPQMGGDLSHYPYGITGAGWPSNYQEITPICDAFLLDFKFWSNLYIPSWNVNTLGVGNSAFDSDVVYYQMDPNDYGKYTDPYLSGHDNPYACDLTGEGEIVPARGPKFDPVTIALNFTRKGSLIKYFPPTELRYAPAFEVAVRYAGPYPYAVCTRRQLWRNNHCPIRQVD